MTNDKDIARSVKMKPIVEIAAKLGMGPECLELHGKHIAKILPCEAPKRERPGRLVMVTAATPGKSGEGKTTTAIGLADALTAAGKKAAAAIREPSLGPVFGMKGGATGGGRAQVMPADAINLHFTGDIHAVSTAHNLLAAMIDNQLYFQGCDLLPGPSVTWKRVLDMNDRALRKIVVGLGGVTNEVPRETGFDIATASEVMAILCLARDLPDLKARLGRICLGFTRDGKPIFASDVRAHGAMAALLVEALKPNLVQTLEGTPAFIHGGPFANIAHGTSSVIATRVALDAAEIVVTETGFASDLGAEKFFNIVVRTGLVPPPDACVLVATLQSLKLQAGVKAADTAKEDPGTVKTGFDNVRKHAENIRKFGLPFVVALNLFPTDAKSEIEAFESLCRADKMRFARSDVFARGGEGGADLAREVLAAAESDPREFQLLYPDEMPLAQKIETVAREIYGAVNTVFKGRSRKKLEMYAKAGFGNLPICVAKTQYSLSDDPKLLNRPKDFTPTVTDVSLSAGAGFVVVLCGDIMTMPGLPKVPAAEHVDVTDDGEIIGVS